MTRDVEAILIAGPTASGKSALALRLAEERRGVVINADSMQVYRELRLLTARPAAEDEARAPHALYGHVPASDAYSAARYAREVAAFLPEARRRGLLPIIAGGTGLYFKALTEGLAPIPEIAPDIRAYWRGEAERQGPAALHEILATRDPEMAMRLRPTDPQRIVRALEVLESTGKSLSHWQSSPGLPVLAEEACERLVIRPERDELRRRCDLRFDRMMKDGALDEVAGLKAMGLDPSLPAMQALGVRALSDHLDGTLSLDEAVERAKAETRQYAKRQETWLRRNMITWRDITAQ